MVASQAVEAGRGTPSGTVGGVDGVDGVDVVAAAEALGPRVRRLAAEIDEQGRLPQELVEAMSDAGLFQLYLPAAAGGPEADPLTAFRVTEALARVDGSVAWCTSISAAVSSFLGWLPPDGLAEVVGSGPPRVRLAGSARPLGVATPEGDGYRVSGHWDFASNVMQSGWYVGTCVIETPGQPSAAAALAANPAARAFDANAANADNPAAAAASGVGGAPPPKIRAFVMPVSDGRVVETWSALGMRGTGSHDFVVEDRFVPRRRVASLGQVRSQPGLIFHPRLTMVVTWSPTAGVALGLARGALDDFAELSSAPSTASPVPLAGRREVQAAVGQAEAIVGAARAYVVDTVSEAWEAAGAERAGRLGASELDPIIARARLAITHAMGEAVRAVDLLIRAAGTGGVFTRAGLERHFRDVHVACQHAAGLPGHVEAAGRVLLGLPAGAPYF